MSGAPPLNPYEPPQEVDQPPAALHQPQILAAMFGCVFSAICLAIVLGAAYFAFELFTSFVND